MEQLAPIRNFGETKQLTFSIIMSVRWCLKSTQRIISGLRKTFIKRYIVERTDRVEIRPEDQSEKAERCRENSWDEIHLKGP